MAKNPNTPYQSPPFVPMPVRIPSYTPTNPVTIPTGTPTPRNPYLPPPVINTPRTGK